MMQPDLEQGQLPAHLKARPRGGNNSIRYNMNHCLVAHRETREVFPEDVEHYSPEVDLEVEGWDDLGVTYKSVLKNELRSEDERLLWLERPEFFKYTRNHIITIGIITFVSFALAGVFLGLGSVGVMAGALSLWAVLLIMFLLRCWCNMFETPRACYALTDQRALVLRFPQGRREVISVTYFEMRSRSGVSNIHFYRHWDNTGSIFFAELPNWGRVGFHRVRDFQGAKHILEMKAVGPRPPTAPIILKKAFVTQLLKEHESPADSAGLTKVEVDKRRSVRAMAILKEQERRRALGISGGQSLLPKRSGPLSGVKNALVRRDSAMSAFAEEDPNQASASSSSGANAAGVGVGNGLQRRQSASTPGGMALPRHLRQQRRQGSTLGPNRRSSHEVGAEDVELVVDDDRRRNKGKGRADPPRLNRDHSDDSDDSRGSGSDSETGSYRRRGWSSDSHSGHGR